MLKVFALGFVLAVVALAIIPGPQEGLRGSYELTYDEFARMF